MVTRATGSPASGRPKRRAARGLLRRGSAAAALLLAGPAAADVVLDGSIGPEPAGPIAPTGTTWLITDHYGAYQGTNLFYSLSQLDVPASWTASFRPQAGTNPPTSNVVVRETPRSPASARDDGSRVPGPTIPSRIARRMLR
jgi:hypothetical protein